MTEMSRSADKDYAYLLGVYLGDGCVTTSQGRPVFRLNTIDQDFAEAVKKSLLAIGCPKVWLSCHTVKKSSKPNWSLTSPDSGYGQRLVSDTEGKRKLPDMSDWTRDEKLALVAGLMDSEGFVAANSNPTNRRFYMGFKCCEEWVADFQRLLESLGIRTGKFTVEIPRKPGYKIPRRFHIKMQSWIDSGGHFNIARKNDRVKEWASAGAYERRKTFARRSISETICPAPEG